MLNNSRTRAAKAKAQEAYTGMDREVKWSMKKNRGDYINDLARQAETSAGQRDLRDLYQVNIPADRQACEGQAWEPTDNNQGTAETMGRTLQ